MQIHPDDRWREWLEAEDRGRETTAEDAFASLLADLPEETVAPAFIERTMAVVHARRARQRRVVWASRAAVTVVAVSAAVLGLRVGGAFVLSLVADGLVAGVQGAVWTADTVGGGLWWWSVLEKMGSAVGKAATAPRSVAALIALQLVGGMAMYGMTRLLGDERAAQEEAHV
ncbi:MAG: hypothetical protein AB7I25_06625 [Vicinamibacterales bacterium]